MWLKVDDSLIHHPKILRAGSMLEGVGRQRAFCVYLEALSWVNRHLTDGYIPQYVICTFTADPQPAQVAEVLAHESVRLWDVVSDGYRIHDYHDHNPDADVVKAKLRRDRERKRAERQLREVSVRTSTRNPRGQAVDVHEDSSALARARSRSRSPVQEEETSSALSAHASHRAHDPESHVASHWLLVKLVHELLEADPTLMAEESELADRLKTRVAQLGVLPAVEGWAAGAEIYKAIESALAQRALPPARSA